MGILTKSSFPLGDNISVDTSDVAAILYVGLGMICTLSDEEEDLDNTSRSLSSSNLSSSCTSRIKSGRETSSGGEVFPTGEQEMDEQLLACSL